jgi:3-hydroxyacyl-[acyl-carrier-protein] dehydratase
MLADTSAQIIDATALQQLLAHRAPFLLVDRIEIIEPGRHVVGRKQLATDDWWADGNPAAPMPHTLVIEALAQTTSALILGVSAESAGALAYFTGVNRARFRHSARAGDELQLDIVLRRWRAGMLRVRGHATVAERTVASAELTLLVRPSK